MLSPGIALLLVQAQGMNSFRQVGGSKKASLSLLCLDSFGLKIMHMPETHFGVRESAPLPCLRQVPFRAGPANLCDSWCSCGGQASQFYLSFKGLMMVCEDG